MQHRLSFKEWHAGVYKCVNKLSITILKRALYHKMQQSCEATDTLKLNMYMCDSECQHYKKQLLSHFSIDFLLKKVDAASAFF